MNTKLLTINANGLIIRDYAKLKRKSVLLRWLLATAPL